jgi:polysaccharide biosynthesis transport protein
MARMADELEPRELDLRGYLRVLQRRKGTIALTALIVVGVALAYSFLQTSVYEGTAEVLVRPPTSESIVNPNADRALAAADAQRAIDTEIKVLQSRTVQDAVGKKLGRVPDVSASAAGGTDVIAVSARSTNAKQAARDANVYARSYLEVRRKKSVDDFLSAGKEVQAKVNDLQRQLDTLPVTPGATPNLDTQRNSLEQQLAYYRQQLDQLQVSAQVSQSGGGQVVSQAVTPGSPVEPKPRRNAELALALGLLLGVGIAFLREYLDDSIRTKEDVERTTGGLPVVGLIPAVSAWRNHKSAYLVSVGKPTSPPAEAYRTLRTSVQFLGLDRPIRSLLVTSPSKEEGKTTTLANLAVSLAQADQRVILVDCDLRRPRVHEFFGLSNKSGFTSALLGTDTLAEAIQPVKGYPSLALLASGPPPPDPSELLSFHQTRKLLDALRSRCDLLLIDSPPVLPVTDPLVLSVMADAALLVVSADRTTKRALHRAVELLTQIDAPLMGTVLNEVGPERAYAYGGGDAAYYRGTPTATEPAGNGGRVRRTKSAS